MERLTIRNSDGSVSQPTDLKWAEALEKLAAYEDTGLEPEEVRPVPPAKWIDFEDGSMCSGCGASHDGVNRNYCPNCGAKMGGANDG